MNWEVKVVFPTSEAPSIKTMYLGDGKELFFEDSSSSVLERKLDFPEWEKVRLQ